MPLQIIVGTQWGDEGKGRIVDWFASDSDIVARYNGGDNAGHSVTALYAIQLKPGAQGRIATISLRWEDPTSGEVKEINGNINSWDMANTYEQASSRYQLDVAVAHWAEILRKSPYVQGYSIWDVEQHAQRISNLLRDDPDAIEFADLVSRSAGMVDLER